MHIIFLLFLFVSSALSAAEVFSEGRVPSYDIGHEACRILKVDGTPLFTSFSADGSLLLIADEKAFYIWNAADGRLEKRIEDERCCCSGRFLGNDHIILSGFNRRRLTNKMEVWNWKKGRKTQDVLFPSLFSLANLRSLPGGEICILESRDRAGRSFVRAWSFETGLEELVFKKEYRCDEMFQMDGVMGVKMIGFIGATEKAIIIWEGTSPYGKQYYCMDVANNKIEKRINVDMDRGVWFGKSGEVYLEDRKEDEYEDEEVKIDVTGIFRPDETFNFIAQVELWSRVYQEEGVVSFCAASGELLFNVRIPEVATNASVDKCFCVASLPHQLVIWDLRKVLDEIKRS
jgi:hypothetical protein